MKINKYSLIVLIVVILVATGVSNFIIALEMPISLLRTLVLAITLSICFILIYFSNLNRVKLCLYCLMLMIVTVIIEHFLPKTFSNELIGTDTLTDFWANILSLVKTSGYFCTLFVVMFAAGFVRRVVSNKPEFTQKFLLSAFILIVGMVGGAMFSAINTLELALFTALSGLLFSGMLYVAYAFMIILNPIPEKYLTVENKNINE